MHPAGYPGGAPPGGIPHHIGLLNRLGQELSHASGAQAGWPQVLGHLRSLLEVSAVSLWLVDGQGRLIRREIADQAGGPAPGAPSALPPPPVDEGLARWQVAHRAPRVLHADGRTHPLPDWGAPPGVETAPCPPLPPGSAAAVSLPIFGKEALRGALSLYADGPMPWFFHPGREEAGEFLRSVAGMLGMYTERRSLEVTNTFFKEIHHRVKNNLQTVASLLRMQLRRLDRISPEEALTQSMNRILSIAQVHETLSQTDVGLVDLGDLVGRITRLLTADLPAPPDVRLVVEGGAVLLGSQQATPLALVFNEMLHNALHHGRADGLDTASELGAGGVAIRIHREGGWLTLRVADAGPGLPPGFDMATRANLGLTIIQTLVEELEGDFHLLRAEPGPGTIALVRFPVCSPDPFAGA
ncbi:MAG: hypothetical protein RLY86_504 [Pseudomonadota bacterium]|jgi:two-component sensor histidine kinase